MFTISDYDYHLPGELIAQTPSARRDQSRLFLLDRKTAEYSHHVFEELLHLLRPSDVLVINNTKVIPGRLYGRKASGGKAEVLILNYSESSDNPGEDCTREFQCLVKTSKKVKTGAVLYFDPGLEARVIGSENDFNILRFFSETGVDNAIERIGSMPLPPYIKRPSGHQQMDDRVAYQTVYASQKGAIAAPTAGLHFSESLLDRLKAKGVNVVAITLHVGYGTFLPVRVENIREHKMHSERYRISPETAEAINLAKENGRRIVAVGTTCVRTLEFASDTCGRVSPGSGNCDLFIYPGYRFKVVDAMLTNFHLPKSTLLMLVAAFAGYKTMFDAYHEAIEKKYRFYSYGDAMLIR
ncbi:MAG: tRNA preQ1(34) S-adenosylmethionine ribosyltransferase-isomerase QueA [Desulfobacterales bacterium]|nr:tRNA preQ1(34) S-adenosylmethionine ribosyltransferase-isomerase QueA [Desulfobacterales bacterium]MDD4070876.1 tRNA preQ1(34) S-adenosylmethionine ribosyltransferase-isomerase QueA [Desulfobacterales bacterium]MDD4392883.1 tRNA preQ1(34) S-adenosylmethionine ribosyltransferase-isomerase QueA [Desulfobacterales bacterium]